MVSVSPGFINIVVPSTGKLGADLISITNPSDKKLAYKVRGTKLDKFDVNPSFGFVPAAGQVTIKILAKGFEANSQLNKNDHFTVLIIVVNTDEADPRRVWINVQPTAIRKFYIKIVYIQQGATTTQYKSNKGTNAVEVKQDEDDDESETGNSKLGKKGSRKSPRVSTPVQQRPQAKSAQPNIIVDDDRTEPPDDLKELPEFQLYYYRRYD